MNSLHVSRSGIPVAPVSRRKRRGLAIWPDNGVFCCLHCRQQVSTLSILSGVHHRNHCPYCLYSRHLDLYQAGDRLAACKGEMQPLGLALKQAPKKYGPRQGELMLIHFCTECGQVSLNRIAADDDCSKILETFEYSLRLEHNLRVRLADNGILALEGPDLPVVRERLYGRN